MLKADEYCNLEVDEVGKEIDRSIEAIDMPLRLRSKSWTMIVDPKHSAVDLMIFTATKSRTLC